MWLATLNFECRYYQFLQLNKILIYFHELSTHKCLWDLFQYLLLTSPIIKLPAPRTVFPPKRGKHFYTLSDLKHIHHFMNNFTDSLNQKRSRHQNASSQNKLYVIYIYMYMAGSGRLWVRWWTFGIHKMRWISWLAAKPVSFSRRTLLHGVSMYIHIYIYIHSIHKRMVQFQN